MIRFLKNQPTLSLSLQSLSTLCLFTYRAIWFCVHKQLHYCLSLISSSSSFRTHFLFCLGLCCKKKSFYWFIGFNLFLICFVWMWVYAKFDILLSSLISLNEEDNDWRRQNCFVSIVHLFTSSNAPIFTPPVLISLHTTWVKENLYFIHLLLLSLPSQYYVGVFSHWIKKKTHIKTLKNSTHEPMTDIDCRLFIW